MARKDLTGVTFGRLTADKIVGNASNGEPKWLCHCSCGNDKIVGHYSLLNGKTQSCGCLQKEMASQANKTHGMSRTRLHIIWKGMRRRCNNPNDASYKNYGGRGITVCSEWSKFEAFYDWSMRTGYAHDLTIDRIDVNGDYCPENCRWADIKVQSNNKRTSVFSEYNGYFGTISQICEKFGINYRTIKSRVQRGWPKEYWFAPEQFSYKRRVGNRIVEVAYKGRKMSIMEASELSGLSEFLIRNRYNKGWPDELIFKHKGFSYKRYLKEQSKQQEANAS